MVNYGYHINYLKFTNNIYAQLFRDFFLLYMKKDTVSIIYFWYNRPSFTLMYIFFIYREFLRT